MIGYVARDADGSLWFHRDIPENNDRLKVWMSEDYMELKDEEFPEFKNLCYRDEPIKVEIKLERI